MAETQPYMSFGAHDVRIYDITTGESLAHLRVIGDVSCEISGETTKVEGGSQNYPWAVAITGMKGSIKLKMKEQNPDALAIFLGGVKTDYTADADGDIIDEANIKGTSLYSSAGFSGVTVIPSTGAAELKPGWYLVKATTSSTFDIYAMSSAGFGRGTDAEYVDDAGKITTTPVAIPSSAGVTTDVAGLGLRFTRGAATLNVTAGDTFRFFVQSPFTNGWKVKFGQNAATFNDVGVIISSEKNDGLITFAHFPKCKCLGGPINFTRKGFAEGDITIEPQYDSVNDMFGEYAALRD